MKESVNEFIVYNKFVTGPLSTEQTFFMETRNALRAAFISPESNDNFTRTIRALPESISSEGMLNCSFSTHPCYAHRKYIPCLYMLSCMLHDAINGSGGLSGVRGLGGVVVIDAAIGAYGRGSRLTHYFTVAATLDKSLTSHCL